VTRPDWNVPVSMQVDLDPPPEPVTPDEPLLPRPDLKVFKFLFRWGEDVTGGPTHARTRSESEALLIHMCSVARNIVSQRWFLNRMAGQPQRFPEYLTIQALATIDPDEFIQMVREAFPDDPDPAIRLSPFLHAEDVFNG
jgi:hypothetical protein